MKNYQSLKPKSNQKVEGKNAVKIIKRIRKPYKKECKERQFPTLNNIK